MFDYKFRAVTPKDLPLLERWIALPHWQVWWGDPELEIANISSHMGSDEVEPMMVELDDKPIAYVQSYDPHLENNHPYRDQPFGTIGIDISIGNASDLNKGHGSNILIALSELLFEEGAVRLILDPHPDNKVAIACYMKAGFAAFDTRTSEYGPALMMALDNPEEFEEEI